VSNTARVIYGAGLQGHYYSDGFWGNGTGNRPANPFTGTGATATEVGGNVVVRGIPTVVENVRTVAQNYGDGAAANFTPGSPAPGSIGNDNHSTVFVGKIRTNEAGDYNIRGWGDDDTHVYVNGVLVSSDPGGHDFPVPIGGDTGGIDFQRTLTLAANTEYDIVVMQAEGGGGSGVYLRWTTPTNATYTTVPETNLRITNTAPTAPTGLRHDTASAAGGVEIDFTETSTNELRFELQRSSAGGEFETINNRAATTGINGTTLVDPTAVPGQTYNYRVAAINFAGSAFSAPLTVTVPQPTERAGAQGYYFNTGFWGSTSRPPNFQVNVADDVPADFNETVPQVRFFFDDQGGSPKAGVINADNHSTVYTGTLLAPETGTYRIEGWTDDDSYVWVNNVLVSADPGGHGNRPPTFVTPINLTAGQEYNFVAMQAEQGGGSNILLRWRLPSNPGTVVDIPASAYSGNIPNAAPDQANGTSAAPTNLTAHEIGQTRVALTWNDVSANELRYVVERTGGGFTQQIALPIGATQYVDPAFSLTPGTEYTYRVRGENFSGDGANATVTITTRSDAQGDLVPTAPANVNARPAGTADAPTVIVSWTDA
jgi:hypothetical protein